MKQEIIRLWSACNQKCLFCNQEENIEKKHKKQILLELLNFKKKWVEKIVISWWEPTLFKEELIFTISTSKKLWFLDIELQSNAVFLSDYKFAENLYLNWLKTAMISFHHFDSYISDELTKAIWTHKKTINWIKNLIKVWVETHINIVINKKNYTNLLEYIKFINNEFIWFKSVSFSIVVPWKLTIKNDLLAKYSDLSNYLIKAYDYCIENNIDFLNPWCWIPVCFIKDYYKYSLEYENYISWTKNDEFILWKNQINKLKSIECNKCILNNYCDWFWKWYIDLYWFEWIKPILTLN